jgi:hypothetical protein
MQPGFDLTPRLAEAAAMTGRAPTSGAPAGGTPTCGRAPELFASDRVSR